MKLYYDNKEYSLHKLTLQLCTRYPEWMRWFFTPSILLFSSITLSVSPLLTIISCYYVKSASNDIYCLSCVLITIMCHNLFSLIILQSCQLTLNCVPLSLPFLLCNVGYLNQNVSIQIHVNSSLSDFWIWYQFYVYKLQNTSQPMSGICEVKNKFEK